MVDVLIERCAGIDIGKDEVVACVRTPAPSGRGRRKQTRTFSSFTGSLEAMADWFTAEGVTDIAMEATGSYWKPVWYVLEERSFALKLVNAHHVKILPGRKSDVLDAEWLAELLEHGLLRGSFVPPSAVRELRDLTRYRKRLIQAHTSECQRIQKALEDAGIKLDSVASDVLGVSGRAMLAALVAGERDPKVLAELAKGVLRRKIPALRQALRGRFTDHHALLIGLSLDHTAHLEAAIARLDERIDTVFTTHTSEASVPFARARDRLDTITGVGKRAAETIIAESGRRGALLRRAPLRTVHATRRRTRLKQAARALRVVVLASCVCGLGARAGRRRVSSGFGSCPACRARHGGRGSRRRLPAGPRSATSVPIPVETGAAGRW
jgi:transposase